MITKGLFSVSQGCRLVGYVKDIKNYRGLPMFDSGASAEELIEIRDDSGNIVGVPL